MGNVCTSDENKATTGRANQDIEDKSLNDGLRGPSKRIEKVVNCESFTPNVEDGEHDNAFKPSESKHSIEHNGAPKHWPKLDELPEITNVEVKITMNRLGDYSYEDGEYLSMEDNTHTPKFRVKLNMKFDNSEFLGVFEFSSQDQLNMYHSLQCLDFQSGPWAQGKQVFQDGSVYEGNYKYGKFYGHGRLIHKNGDYYEGAFINSLAEGQGKFVSFQGESYEGTWENNLPHGKGVHKSLNGDLYTGDFLNGKRDGKGELTTSSYVYIGDFSENEFCGTGT